MSSHHKNRRFPTLACWAVATGLTVCALGALAWTPGININGSAAPSPVQVDEVVIVSEAPDRLDAMGDMDTGSAPVYRDLFKKRIIFANEVPLGGTGVTGAMGVGGGGMTGSFGYRDGGGRKAVTRFGGSVSVQPVLPIGSHSRLVENKFFAAADRPFSTFSVDVDTASYSMVRQQLGRSYMPHPDSVRIEEMVNYFSYEYPQPKGDVPFSTSVEIAGCPWNSRHRLVRIGLKGREIKPAKRPPSNLVFLLDVSGSMSSPNKLAYVKASMRKLVGQLGENDRVAIVVYAGAAGQVLPSTTCDKKRTILDALGKLAAGGSTAGGAGIKLAYDVAVKNLIKGGVNRVILCTDGDFNVGTTSRGDLERLIEDKAKSGVFLSILGFGMGNYRDGSMEALSNKGNGNYAYIDTLKEAEKVLVKQINGTLVTIAKDVKIQVNFNKHRVSAYRLIGYVNRKLRKEDFNNDKKDAGEIGAGHTVTALYEVVPFGTELPGLARADEDKYSDPPSSEFTELNGELLTVRLRYKLPDGKTSSLLETPVKDSGRKLEEASDDYKFAASVVGFGMLLRDSKHRGNLNYAAVIKLGTASAGKDPEGYRKEFLSLVGKAKAIDKRKLQIISTAPAGKSSPEGTQF
jgi:Ca-activated chloride channel homolog